MRFLGHFDLKIGTFCLFATPKQMSFLTISNKNVILKTQRIRLGATVEPHIGLEQVLITFFSFYILHEMCFANNFHSFTTVIILNTF